MALRRLGRRTILSGPVLIGFSDLFDRSYGDPKTPRPYPKVTPSRMGEVLLPFACPHCGVVKSEMVQPEKRGDYRDRDRGFSWCPSCRGRYFVKYEGTPLTKALPKGATSAPVLIERDGTQTVLEPHTESGLDALGAWC